MSHLRVAGEDERPPKSKTPPTPKSITEALDLTGRDVLAAMRKQLAEKLDRGEVASNAIASAYKELRELDRQIRTIDTERAVEEAKRDGDDDRQRRSFDASAI